MKMLKVFAIFVAGALTGAAALFFLLAYYGSNADARVDKKPVSAISVNKQESCLISAAEQARDIYNDLTVRRGNLGTKMEFQLVSQNEMDKENMIKKELYARVGSLIEPCIMFGEPVKLNRNILADIR